MIENASDNDSGVYECMAKSPAGEVKSRQATMKASTGTRVKPRFVHPPVDVDVLEGSSASLTCDVIGNPKPELSWTFNDDIVIHRTNERIRISPDGQLTIPVATKEDSGTYRCAAVNQLGKIAAAAQIRVLSIPSVIESPRNQTAYEGATVEFTCQASGYPVPLITWLKAGSPVILDDRISFLTADGKLRIQNVRLGDQGTYSCRATNNFGFGEAHASLSVLPVVASGPQQQQTTAQPRRAPFFTKTPESVEVSVGFSVQLNCQADGYPVPTILWRRNGHAVQQTFHTFVNSGNLIMHNVNKSDAGSYECTAISEMGVIVARAQLQVKDEPIAPNRVANKLLFDAVEEAKRAVDLAVNDTITALFARDRSSRLTHSELIKLTRFPTAAAREVARAAEVYERALSIVRRHLEAGVHFNLSREFQYSEVLTGNQLQLIANLSGCLTHRRVPDCSDMCFHSNYRTYDGTCNNFQNPLWGSSYTSFYRLLPPIYENGFNLPVGWSRSVKYNGFSKPSARLVSTRVITTKETTSDETFTHMLMQWGQFIDHDLDLAVPGMASESFGEHVDCRTSCEYSAPCFPIEIPPNDPRVKNHHCMEFVRNSAVCGSGTTSVLLNTLLPREQINQLTSFIDASMVYGSTDKEALELRDINSNNGHLRWGIVAPSGKPLMPFARDDTPVDCKRDHAESDVGCFLAGDVRANEQVGLLTMHTLWFREHNRIASELRNLNPHWDGDMLYHEARKIVGAQIQHITYQHWLPHILGPKGMNQLGEYKGYDPRVDATISNIFATAALRMGHGLIQPVLQRLNSTFQPIREGHLPLQNAFFSPWRLVEEGGMDPILRGLFAAPAKVRLSEQLLNSDLTETLFRPAHLVAQDLAALNIQRGRDHALPGYNDWRRHCNLTVAETFQDLKNDIKSQALRDKLQQLYGHPSNVDIWVGGMAEDPVDGAKVGPTFRCLLVDQFRRLRDGDRFWYENPGVFKPAQLTQIRQSSLSRIICDSGDDIRDVTLDVFKMPALQNPSFTACPKVPKIDLRVWTECCHDCSSSGNFNSLTRLPGRQRRSLEHSFLEDRQDSLQTLSNEPTVAYNATRKLKTANRAAKVADNNEVFKRQRDLEEADERIEGLEALMAQLQRTLRKMTRKLRQVEAVCYSTAAAIGQPVNGGRGCTYAGSLRKNGEEWLLDSCTTCNCKDGLVRCTTIQCPPCATAATETIDGQCCPVCQE